MTEYVELKLEMVRRGDRFVVRLEGGEESQPFATQDAAQKFYDYVLTVALRRGASIVRERLQ